MVVCKGYSDHFHRKPDIYTAEYGLHCFDLTMAMCSEAQATQTFSYIVVHDVLITKKENVSLMFPDTKSR